MYIKVNDDKGSYFSAIAYKDKEGKLHIYNPMPEHLRLYFEQINKELFESSLKGWLEEPESLQ